MIREDVFTSPIDFALQETIKQYENKEEKYEKFIYEALRRSQKIWENISIYGINTVGMTYGEFCDQFKDKRNIVFLSDDEMRDFTKAKRIIDVMND